MMAGLMRALVSGLSRAADDMADARFWQDALWSAPSATGIAINQQTALSSSAVMACVTMLSEDVAKLPWTVKQKLDDGSKREAKNHYLYSLLQEPNDWQNGFELREMSQISLIMRGNGYMVIVRNGRGMPVKFIPINADWVSLWEAPTGELFYRVTPQGLHLRAELADQPFLIPLADMFHVRGFSLNGLMGVSRIALGKDTIGLAIAQEQQAARWMGNGARPSGILTTDQKLTEAAAKRVSEDWQKLHGGLINSGKTAVLEQGLQFQRLDMTSSDMEFIASRKFQLEDIIRIFRVPAHMVGILDRSTNNNISQQAQEYVNYTLTGYTNRYSRKFETHFGLWQQGLSVDFDYSELTVADLTARINNWRTAIMSMIAKPDEARIDLGWQPEGGEASRLHYPQNMASEGSQSTGTKADDGGRPAASESPARAETPAWRASVERMRATDNAALNDIARRLRAVSFGKKEYVHG